MKKILVTFAAAFTLAAFAEVEDVAHIRLADRDACVKAAAKLGEWSGNPMLGAMLAAQVAQADVFKKKASQAGKPLCLRLVLDKDELDVEPCKNGVCASSSRALDGLVEVTFNAQGLTTLARALEKTRMDKDQPVDMAALKDLSAARVVLRLGANGLDMTGELTPIAGSELSKVGLKPLAADPFAFAPANALCASAHAADSGVGDQRATCDAVLAVFKRNGVKLDFLKLDRGDGRICVTLDSAALTQYAQGEGKTAFQKLDPKTFVGEVQAAVKGSAFTAPCPAFASSFGVAGCAPKGTASRRFAAIFPEAKGKPLFSASVGSLYALFKAAVLPQLVSGLDAKTASQVKPMLAMLPEEGAGGVAVMQWRENGRIKFLFRVSKDEVRSIGAAANVAMGLMMSGALKGADDLDDLDDACDDDDDD